jgi:hypothetical protein
MLLDFDYCGKLRCLEISDTKGLSQKPPTDLPLFDVGRVRITGKTIGNLGEGRPRPCKAADPVIVLF